MLTAWTSAIPQDILLFGLNTQYSEAFRHVSMRPSDVQVFLAHALLLRWRSAWAQEECVGEKYLYI